MQQLVEQAVEIRALANTVAEFTLSLSKGCRSNIATALDPHSLRQAQGTLEDRLRERWGYPESEFKLT